MSLSKEETKHLLDQASCFRYVRFVWPDVNGISRGKIVVNNGSALSDNIKHGTGVFDGAFWMGPNNESPVWLETTVWGNCLYKPVSDKFRSITWAGGRKYSYGEILCEPFDLNGKMLESNTRFVARKQLEELSHMGLKLYSAFEAECYLLDRKTLNPVRSADQLCSPFVMCKYEDLMFEIEEKLRNYGVLLETILCEHSPGQFEFTFLPSYGIESADMHFLFREAMKELCDEKGFLATFMTQPFGDYYSSALHFNHSLWTTEGTNAFYDVDGGFSKICKHFIAGILKHAKAITALCCPMTNCYRRLNSTVNVTPSTVAWAVERRDVMLRAKHIPSQSNTYLENRLPSGSSNPYLVLASTVAAGIDGIKTKEALPPEGTSVETLPLSLSDALNALSSSEVMKAALGEDFVEKFVTCKTKYSVEKFGKHNLSEAKEDEIEAERCGQMELL